LNEAVDVKSVQCPIRNAIHSELRIETVAEAKQTLWILQVEQRHQVAAANEHKRNAHVEQDWIERVFAA
jgi:hypothetical protein